jgi:hypothetical protein
MRDIDEDSGIELDVVPSDTVRCKCYLVFCTSVDVLEHTAGKTTPR